MTIEIQVIENGIPYICYVDAEDIYIKVREFEMNHLSDEQKMLKAIYKIWLEDKSFLTCLGSDIPPYSPYYGKRWYHMESISLSNIEWVDKEAPSKILEIERLRFLCNSMLLEVLEIDFCRVGVDASGNFMISTKYGTMHFLKKTLRFYFGGFDTDNYMFVPKKEKLGVIERIQMAIEKNRNLIIDFMNAY